MARPLIPLLASVLALAVVPPAVASEPLPDTNVTFGSLQVNRKGEALLTYRRASGQIRRALVWGAVDARTPDPGVRQVRFSYDLAGGWGKYRKLAWKTFRNACRRYAGPPLPMLVAACTAPDGSHWAVQSWVRRAPLLGFEPFRPEHTAVELHLSHWRAPLATLELFPNWTYGGGTHGIFGRLSWSGAPVYGFGTTSTGNPRDRYVRNVYLDTLDSPYGPGWRRESGIVTHRGTGTFCHSFVPQRPHAGYPSEAMRPAGVGTRYRATVMGPGVTPVLQVETAAPERGADRAYDAVFDRVMAGDRICAAER